MRRLKPSHSPNASYAQKNAALIFEVDGTTLYLSYRLIAFSTTL
jgi:hypothetical protein